MAIIEKDTRTKIEIYLKSPQGNAFYLIGAARQYGKQLEFSEEEIDSIIENMMSGDFENLIHVFDNNFGDYIDLIK